MSLWEFRAAVDGWAAVHGGEPKPEAPTAGEYEAAVRASHRVDERIAARGKGQNTA